MEFIFEILKSVIYGVIQGITEWLPISSTGHLILLNTVLPLNVFNDAAKNIAFWDMYKVVIQFGSILAVALIYFEKLNPFSAKKNKIEKQSTWNLWIKIIVATIPAGIAGVLLDDFIDAKFSTPVVVAVALIVYGVFINAGLLFLIKLILSLAIFPVLFASVISIIMMFFMQLLKNFRNKDMIQTVISLVLVVLIVFAAYIIINNIFLDKYLFPHII